MILFFIPSSQSISGEDVIINSETGEYPVFVERSEIEMSSGHTVDLTIYYPGYNRLLDKQSRDRDAPFPVVIFSPGAGGTGVAPYTNLVSDLATFGFIVVGVNWYYEDNRENDVAHMDHTKVIDQIGDMSDTRSSPLHDLADTSNCGAYGHSRGGRAAFMASSVDDRINSVCAWMPTLNNASSIDQSSNKLLFAGIFDEVAYPSGWTDPLYESCGPSIVYVITNGDHTPNEEIHGDITFKFFRYHLKEDSSMEPEVYGDEIKQRARSGEFHLKIKTVDGEYDSGLSEDVDDEEDEEPEEEPTEEEPEEDPVEEEPEIEDDDGLPDNGYDLIDEGNTEIDEEVDLIDQHDSNDSDQINYLYFAIPVIILFIVIIFIYFFVRRKGIS